MSWWKRDDLRPAHEAVRAVEDGERDLARVREFRNQANIVSSEARESLARNNYGRSLTAAMTGKEGK